MFDLHYIMRRAWTLRKEKGYTMGTALRLAWGEAKGVKRYALNLENLRALISGYLARLIVTDEHQQHKRDALRMALLAPVDALGVAVLDGKTTGLCKYAARNGGGF